MLPAGRGGCPRPWRRGAPGCTNRVQRRPPLHCNPMLHPTTGRATMAPGIRDRLMALDTLSSTLPNRATGMQPRGVSRHGLGAKRGRPPPPTTAATRGYTTSTTGRPAAGPGKAAHKPVSAPAVPDSACHCALRNRPTPVKRRNPELPPPLPAPHKNQRLPSRHTKQTPVSRFAGGRCWRRRCAR